MSFQAFKYVDLDTQTWEDSDFRQVLETKFLFAIFGEDHNGEEIFLKAMYWNMPFQDREEARKVWERAQGYKRSRY